MFLPRASTPASPYFLTGAPFSTANYVVGQFVNGTYWYEGPTWQETDGASGSTIIQAAINGASNAGGGLVYVQAGSYLCSSAITMNMMSNVTLAGAGRDTTILTMFNTVTTAILDVWNSSNIQVHDLGFNHNCATFAGPACHDVAVLNSTNVQIYNNHLQQFGMYGLSLGLNSEYDTGAVVKPDMFTDIYNNIFDNSGFNTCCFEMEGGSWVRICNNRFFNGYGDTCAVYANNETPVANVQFTGNVILNGTGTGLIAGPLSGNVSANVLSNLLVANNFIANQSTSGIHIMSPNFAVSAWGCNNSLPCVYTSNVTITGNTIFNCTSPISCDATTQAGSSWNSLYESEIIVSQNQIVNCSGTGIYLSNITNSIVSENIIGYEAGKGIQMDVGSNIPAQVQIANNQVYNTSTSNAHGISVSANNPYVHIEGNNLENITGYGIYSASPNVMVSGNSVYSTSNVGVYVISTNNDTVTGNMLYEVAVSDVLLTSCTGTTVSNNIVTLLNGDFPIGLSTSNLIIVSGNTVSTGYTYGLRLYYSTYVSMTGNNIHSANYAILEQNSSYVVVEANILNGTSHGFLFQNNGVAHQGTGDIILNNIGYQTFYQNSANNATATTWTFTCDMGDPASGTAPTSVVAFVNSTAMSAKGLTWSYSGHTLTVTSGGSTGDSTVQCSVIATYQP
jgi:hypothetical protein